MTAQRSTHYRTLGGTLSVYTQSLSTNLVLWSPPARELLRTIYEILNLAVSSGLTHFVLTKGTLTNEATKFFLMNRVYSSAEHVLVWLGDHQGRSNFAMDRLKDLASGQEFDIQEIKLLKGLILVL